MNVMHAYSLVRRLFAAIGTYPWQQHLLDRENKFVIVMTRNHPQFNWNDLMMGIRVYED